MMDTQPMKQGELGRYVCVARGGCLHSPEITIEEGGVWVREKSGGPISSAHGDCFEAWQARERDALTAVGQRAAGKDQCKSVLVAPDHTGADNYHNCSGSVRHNETGSSKHYCGCGYEWTRSGAILVNPFKKR